jgi:cell division protease FtsH
LPTEDKHFHSQSEFIDDIAMLLAGHAAEKEVFGEVTTGASSDLRQATILARQLITDYGMSDTLGPRTFGEKEEMIFLGREIKEQKDYSEKMAEAIDKEIDKLISNAYKTAKEIITRMRPKLNEIADLLLEKETIEREEFEAMFNKKNKTSDK